MIIELPKGEKKIIEQRLDDFGSVIRGEIQPEEFLSDANQARELRDWLRFAELQVKRNRELLQPNNRLLDFVSDRLSSKIAEFKDLLQGKDQAIISLREQLQKEMTEYSKEAVEQALKNVKLNNRSFYRSIELFVVTAMVGTVATTAPAWIKFISDIIKTLY
ncbi:MAG: hypothetical protein GY866_05970 [Proteobacteria bacterium]|nr:hypothetical protein [Pseudomonadota bacterium]